MSEPQTSQLIDRLHAINAPKVLVVGDLILDRYQWGIAERVSQEAPVLLLREENSELRLGGAANVANMLTGLNAQVFIAGVIGDDQSGVALTQLFEQKGIDCTAVLSDYFRPTTVKERIMGSAPGRSPTQMLRIDRESREPLNEILTTKILDRIICQIPKSDVVLISDYGKGVCTPEILKRIIEVAKDAQIPIIVDPAHAVPSSQYQGVTTITPNRLEAQMSTGIKIDSIKNAFNAGQKLIKQANCENVFLTLDREGIVVVQSNGKQAHFPTRTRNVCDITGAGDMVLAMIGATAATKATPEEQIQLANIAGGLEVEQVGVTCISKQEILNDLLKNGYQNGQKIYKQEELENQIVFRKAAGERVVFTNGCFDILHAGHITYLRQAASLGDCLVVGINSDDSIKLLEKGTGRPFCSQQERATLLEALEFVDYVTIFNEATPLNLIKTVKPNCLVKGGDYETQQIVGREFVESYGGEVHALQLVPGLSTSSLVQRILDSQITAIKEVPENHVFPIPEEKRKAG